ncbi:MULTISPECIES: hypothetical protein [Dickeya]|nr:MULTISPECIES: hypothetical protein [Dickeya]
MTLLFSPGTPGNSAADYRPALSLPGKARYGYAQMTIRPGGQPAR